MTSKPKVEYLKPKISTNLKDNSLSGPRGIVQDYDSELLYIADAGMNVIRVLKPDLEPFFRFGSSKTLSTPAGVCIVDSILYVCNWGSHVIAIFTLEGEEITLLKEVITSYGKEKLTQPIGITYNKPNDEIFVCDYGGDMVKRFNDIQHIFAKVSKPFDIKLTEEYVIVVTGENTCFRFYDREGQLMKHIISSNQTGSLIGNPSFFGVDSRNTIWLSDYKRHCILQINMDGTILRAIGGKKPTSQKDLFSHPTGLLLDKEGFLISACVRNPNQVQKFDIKRFR